jgi:hypothetical protein
MDLMVAAGEVNIGRSVKAGLMSLPRKFAKNDNMTPPR